MRVFQNTTSVNHLRTLDGERLRNIWYEMWYHPRQFARGKGSVLYVKELACFASNLSTFKMCGDTMYRDIAEKCAAKAEMLRAKYQEAT